MRIVRTDDAAIRLEFTYRGNPKLSFGSGARLPMIGAGIALIPPATLAWWAASQPINWIGLHPLIAYPLRILIALILGVGLSVLLLRAIGRHVNSITPLSYHQQAFKRELSAPRPDNEVTVDLIDLGEVRFAEDDPAHRRIEQFGLPQASTNPVSSNDRTTTK